MAGGPGRGVAAQAEADDRDGLLLARGVEGAVGVLQAREDAALVLLEALAKGEAGGALGAAGAVGAGGEKSCAQMPFLSGPCLTGAQMLKVVLAPLSSSCVVA